jgi:vacuolar-type H+-ATPase subunit E/Vma4
VRKIILREQKGEGVSELFVRAFERRLQSLASTSDYRLTCFSGELQNEVSAAIGGVKQSFTLDGSKLKSMGRAEI